MNDDRSKNTARRFPDEQGGKGADKKRTVVTMQNPVDASRNSAGNGRETGRDDTGTHKGARRFLPRYLRACMRLWQRRLRRLADGRKGPGGIAVASFLETTIVPIPIEILIAPIMAASRRRGFMVASVTLAGSVAGAVFLYGLAAGLFDETARPLLALIGGEDEFASLTKRFEAGGFWVVFAISLAPVPMQIAALAAGATSYSFAMFLVAIIVSRGVRYYGLWLLVRWFGAGIAALIMRR